MSEPTDGINQALRRVSSGQLLESYFYAITRHPPWVVYTLSVCFMNQTVSKYHLYQRDQIATLGKKTWLSEVVEAMTHLYITRGMPTNNEK